MLIPCRGWMTKWCHPPWLNSYNEWYHKLQYSGCLMKGISPISVSVMTATGRYSQLYLVFLKGPYKIPWPRKRVRVIMKKLQQIMTLKNSNASGNFSGRKCTHLGSSWSTCSYLITTIAFATIAVEYLAFRNGSIPNWQCSFFDLHVSPCGLKRIRIYYCSLIITTIWNSPSWV